MTTSFTLVVALVTLVLQTLPRKMIFWMAFVTSFRGGSRSPDVPLFNLKNQNMFELKTFQLGAQVFSVLHTQ